MRKVLLLLFFLSTYTISNIKAQVAIGSTTPNPSSQLDVIAPDKGLLFPRVALTSSLDTTTITNGNVFALTVFNTATIADITPGYYYWDGARWQRLLNAEDVTVVGTGTVSSPNNSVILGGTPTNALLEDVELDINIENGGGLVQNGTTGGLEVNVSDLTGDGSITTTSNAVTIGGTPTNALLENVSIDVTTVSNDANNAITSGTDGGAFLDSTTITGTGTVSSPTNSVTLGGTPTNALFEDVELDVNIESGGGLIQNGTTGGLEVNVSDLTGDGTVSSPNNSVTLTGTPTNAILEDIGLDVNIESGGGLIQNGTTGGLEVNVSDLTGDGTVSSPNNSVTLTGTPTNAILEDIGLDVNIESGGGLIQNGTTGGLEVNVSDLAGDGTVSSPNNSVTLTGTPTNAILEDIGLDVNIESGGGLIQNGTTGGLEVNVSDLTGDGTVSSPNNSVTLGGTPTNALLEDLELDVNIESGGGLIQNGTTGGLEVNVSDLAGDGSITSPNNTIILTGTPTNSLLEDVGIDINLNAIDGSETAVTGAGINVVTGSGTTADPYIVTGTEIDGSITNEINTVFQVNGANLEITDSNGTLTVPVSDINTDNQQISLAGNSLTLGNGTGADSTVDLSTYANTDHQQISLMGNTLTLGNGTGADSTVDLSNINTDNQQLTISGNTLTLGNGTGTDSTVDLTTYANTDAQTISLASNTLTLGNGTGTDSTADLTPYLDNTDAQTISLASNTLTLGNGTGTDSTVDLSTYANTDHQQISLTGTTLTLGNGTGADSTADLSNINTDAQTISLAGNTLTLGNGTGTDSTVDLTTYANTDAQTISLAGNTLTLGNGTGTDSTADLTAFANTDAQTISLASNILTLGNGTGSDSTANLAPYLDNTDAQTISLAGNTLTLGNGTGTDSTVDLTTYANTDAQTISLAGNTLTLGKRNRFRFYSRSYCLCKYRCTND